MQGGAGLAGTITAGLALAVDMAGAESEEEEDVEDPKPRPPRRKKLSAAVSDRE
jgi:hypothetical protein